MPDLPDFEAWREYGDATALHQPIVGLGYGASGLRLHFGMTGALRYYRRGAEPDHTLLRIDFENGFHRAFQNTRKLGMIALLGPWRA